MELFEAIDKRCSNRKYLDKQISDEDLKKILKEYIIILQVKI